MDKINNNVLMQEDEISLTELLGIFKPYVFVILAVGIVFSLISYMGTKFLVDPVYESSATLIVNNRREESSGSITNDEITSAKNLAAVYSIIIKSDAVMGPVVENTYSHLSTGQLASNISVSAVDSTQVFRVSVRNTDPESALKYAQEIVKVAPDIIVDMVEAGSVRIVSNPKLPTSPVSPNAMMNAAVALVIGIMLAGGIVLLRYFLDRTFRSPQDIEQHLGIPVIGIIPNYESVQRGGK